MIDPIVYHPDLGDRGLNEYRVWPYRCDKPQKKKHRHGDRWRAAR